MFVFRKQTLGDHELSKHMKADSLGETRVSLTFVSALTSDPFFVQHKKNALATFPNIRRNRSAAFIPALRAVRQSLVARSKM